VNDETRFQDVVLADPTVAAVLQRAPSLGVGTDEGPSCPPSLARSGRDPARGPTGVRDADLFYSDPDTPWDAEDAVIRRGAALSGDLPVPVEIRPAARLRDQGGALDDDLAGVHRAALGRGRPGRVTLHGARPVSARVSSRQPTGARGWASVGCRLGWCEVGRVRRRR
jgi:hypothetical protein